MPAFTMTFIHDTEQVEITTKGLRSAADLSLMGKLLRIFAGLHENLVFFAEGKSSSASFIGSLDRDNSCEIHLSYGADLGYRLETTFTSGFPEEELYLLRAKLADYIT